jgi:aspartate aminotransferase/aminotransferase
MSAPTPGLNGTNGNGAARNLPPMRKSRKVQEIPQALSIYVNQIVYDLKRRGKDVITLSLGEAFFDIPLFDFKKLDIEKCYHYSDSQGIPELRRKIADFYKRQYGAEIDVDGEILITAGSKAAIYMAMQATLDPGDEMLTHEPAWLSYQEHARLLGVEPKFIPYDCPVAEFERYFTPKTRMVVLNNPNNPAGRVYQAEDLERLYEQCRGRGIYILIDEAYSDFSLDEGFATMAKIVPDKDGVIVVNSLSKNMGMSGWRVGYIITHRDLLPEILKINQHLITCAPSILLHYLARYFDQITAITLPQVSAVVRKRAEVAAMMDKLQLQRLDGASTFYFFVSIEDYPGTSHDFAMQLLLNQGIASVPGTAYGESTGRFVRVSIGTESKERIWQALVALRDQIDTGALDRDGIAEKLGAIGMQPFVAPARA